MRNVYLLFVIVTISLLSCKQENKKIEIIGETVGYEDSTEIILINTETNITIDTTYISDNKFQFEISLEEPTVFSILVDFKNPSEFDYKFFWVTDKPVEIFMKKGNMRYAKVKGSEIESQADILVQNRKNLESSLDSVQNAIKELKATESDVPKELINMQFEIFNKMTTEDTLFIRNYPNSLHSVYVLTYAMKALPKDDTKKLFESLSNELKESKYGERVKSHLYLSRTYKLGDKMEDFHLPDTNGQQIGLCNFQNKFLLVEFWSSGCRPCRKENPNLVKNYKRFRKEGFEILGITLDERKNDWIKAVKEDSISWITVGDLKGIHGEVPTKFNIRYIPKNYLLDTNGIIIAEDLRGEGLTKKLEEIFKLSRF